MNIKKITKNCNELHVHKFDSLDKMDQFLERHKLQQPTQYKIDYVNSPITIKEIKFVI